MYCQKCGQELDANNICQNPSCPSNINSNYNANTTYNSGYSESPSPYSQPVNYSNNNYGYDNTNQYDDYNGITPSEMMDFIGDKNTEYYMEKWSRADENPKFISWNWPSFFFGFIWAAYRKMYGIAGILFGIGLVKNLIFQDLLDTPGLSLLISLIIMVVVGLLGNQLYIQHCIKKINKIKISIPGLSADDISRRLRANGGINWIPVIVIIGLYVVLFLLVFVAFAALFGAAGNLYF